METQQSSRAASVSPLSSTSELNGIYAGRLRNNSERSERKIRERTKEDPSKAKPRHRRKSKSAIQEPSLEWQKVSQKGKHSKKKETPPEVNNPSIRNYFKVTNRLTKGDKKFVANTAVSKEMLSKESQLVSAKGDKDLDTSIEKPNLNRTETGNVDKESSSISSLSANITTNNLPITDQTAPHRSYLQTSTMQTANQTSDPTGAPSLKERNLTSSGTVAATKQQIMDELSEEQKYIAEGTAMIRKLEDRLNSIKEESMERLLLKMQLDSKK